MEILYHEMMVSPDMNPSYLKRVLLAGFEPFNGATENPSAELVNYFKQNPLDGIEIDTVILPVSFYRAEQRLQPKLEQNYDVVLGLGLAAGRNHISVERIALNLIDARIPDETGHQPIDQKVIDGGPLALSTSLPVKAICKACNELDVPTKVSYTAGTFVCNATFYQICNYQQKFQPNMLAGFIHVPWFLGQGQEGEGLAKELQFSAIAKILEVCAENPREINESAGTIS